MSSGEMVAPENPCQIMKDHPRMEQKQNLCTSVYDQIPPLSANYPWFVAQKLDAEDETEVQIFYNLHDPLSHFRCRIPQLLGKRVRGFFYGWVILSDHRHCLKWSLWNPVTSKFIFLPRLINKQSDSADEDDIQNLCLSSSPDDPNSILLMTRTGKPHLVFCRLYPKRKKLRWIEMSYAKQIKKITGVDDDFLVCLTCCNGKVYAYAKVSWLVVELSIVVKDTGVVINLLSLLKFPAIRLHGYSCFNYLVGSCEDIFFIFIDLAEFTEAIVDVRLFRLNMDCKTWEEAEDLKHATISLIDGYLSQFHSLADRSELGGYIHILGENGKIMYSYHVKDKTVSSSSRPFLVGTSHMSAAWAMLECERLLEDDHKQKEDKNDKMVLTKDKSNQFEFNGMTYESQLLNLPFDVLKMIMEFTVGIEYMNFRASCKLCHIAAPVIQWSNQTASKRLQLISPWLMLIRKHTISLIDPMFGDKYGWLLMRESGKPHFFFNPFTSATRELPLVFWLECFDFSAPPTSPDCMVVGFTCHLDYFYIHFVGRESSWRICTLNFGNGDPDFYRFPAFYGGDVYALCNGKGVVDVFKELGAGDESRKWETYLREAPISCCTSKAQHFLVKCDHEYKCDQHLILVIVGEFGESVEVFIPNEDEGKWEKIDDIGRHVIYISDKTSLCMEAKTPNMENKIYFPRFHSGKIVVYSLETCKLHTFNGKNIHESFGDFFGTINHPPHNVWIEPSW